MKKFLLYGAGACLAIAIIVSAVLYAELDAIVKTAVETLGPKLTRTQVRLDSARISPFSGSGRLRGLFIGNPPGYKTPSAFQLRSVHVAVDLKSLRGDRIVIREIIVDSPVVTFEGSLAGGSNLSRIQKNVQSFVPSPAKGAKSAKEKRVEIGLFKLTHGQVILNMKELGGSGLTIPLPDIELHDIGRKSGGATVQEAAGKIFGAITASVLKAVAGAGNILRNGAKQLQNVQKSATGAFKSLFKKGN